jgi:hypothetical protein
MMWIAFWAGIMVGTLAGVVAVALCQMTSRHKEHKAFSCRPDCQYEALRSPLLVKDAE